MNSLHLSRAAIVVALLAIGTTAAFAGLNPNVTLPLHAKASSFEPCTGYLPVDCYNIQPTVNINPGPVAIFLLIWNYNAVNAVQTAFQPDPSWTFAFGLWDCQVGQLSAVVPAPPWGPQFGSIATAFNCVVGPALAPIGRMFFIAGSTGCLSQIQSSYPFGIHLIDCQGGMDHIPDNAPYRLGTICVGQGGHNACELIVPVEPATWGSIKAQYE